MGSISHFFPKHVKIWWAQNKFQKGGAHAHPEGHVWALYVPLTLSFFKLVMEAVLTDLSMYTVSLVRLGQAFPMYSKSLLDTL